MRWQLLHPDKVTSLDEFRQVLLKNRSISDEKIFFTPPSPLDLSLKAVGIKTAAANDAIKLLQKHKQDQIIVFGDYDADGICATAVMWLTLNSLGYKAMPFIPHRTKHGYGISQKALDELLATEKPALVISVDNGIVAHEPIVRLRQEGIDVIITDHHQTEAKLPDASVIFHTTQLCGTTVAWMLAREVLRAAHPQAEADQIAENLLDLCGIATIADQVPLLNANRSFAVAGVKVLKKSQRPGVQALCQIAEIAPADITAETVNYALAPRINAMGRLDHALDALRLLCTGNLKKAQEYAAVLQNTNVRRQGLTDDMLKDAETQAQNWQDEHIIIVASAKYHEGVVGLIAGRLMEKYSKPAIAIAMNSETGKASARSILGINIVELIREVRDDLLEVGGHPMAAGFGLETVKLELVTKRLQAVAKKTIKPDMLIPTQRIDCELGFSLVNMKLAEVIKEFEPFGQGNPQPIVKLCGLTILEKQTIGKNHQHLKFFITDKNNEVVLPVLAWNVADRFEGLENSHDHDVCVTVEVNTWKNRSQLQLVLKAIT